MTETPNDRSPEGFTAQERAAMKERAAEVGFNEVAHLDEGDMWPTAFAVTAMTPRCRSTSPSSSHER